MIAFPERDPGVRRKRVFLPPAPFVSVPIDHYAGGLASPALHSKRRSLSRGQGGDDPTSNLPSLSPNGSIPSAQKLLWLHPHCGHRAAQLEDVMPTFMMDDGMPPPRDELSTSCVIHCLESELYFTVVFMLLCNWRSRKGYTFPLPFRN